MVGTRQAQDKDARRIAEIEVETWRSTYAGLLTDQSLINMSVPRQTRMWQSAIRHYPGDIWVSEGPDSSVTGFGHCGPQRNGTLPFSGEIYMLYVALDAQGFGYGRQLLLAQFERLVATGRSSALIWVVSANPARFFYQAMGGKLVLNRQTPVSGGSIETAGYGWADLPALLQSQTPRGAQSTGGRSAS